MENPPNLTSVSRCEGYVSAQGYEEELRSERSYVAGLYARLDAERARVKGEYDAALRGNGGTPVERDVEVRALAKDCLLYTSPSPRDRTRSRMPSSA